MPATHGNIDLEHQIIDRRKRAFKAALLIGGNSQGDWARRHEINETEVSNVLAGRRQNPIVLGLIYKEIERFRKAASTYMAEAL